MSNREVDQGRPDGREDDPRAELHAIRESAGNQAHSQAGEHRLEDHVSHQRVRLIRPRWRKSRFQTEVVGEAADESTVARSVRHRIAVQRPQNADDEQRTDDHHQHVENGLRSVHSSIEERQTGNH